MFLICNLNPFYVYAKMSAVGFDFGNESCVVAVARQTGIDVVLNDESNCKTPAIVYFGDKQHFIGTAGAATTRMNPKNSISQVKRLIGRQFSDPELQKDLKSLPFDVTEGPDGYPLIHAQYLGEVKTFTPTQVLGMLFSDLKVIAEKNLNMDVSDCCIGIPVYFTDLQRRAVLDAATIAGLRPLCLIHETTAIALAYGIYKPDLPESEQVNVAFVDIGHASMQVCIVGFKKGQLKILSHASERSLGGRDFDEVIFQYFVAKFREEYKIDVLSNVKACLRLRAACERAKKVLSAYAEAPIYIDSLMDEKDVMGLINREEFEQISAPILECVKRTLVKALDHETGLTVDNIHTVEVVGSGSRVPAIIRILTEFFGKEPRRTMNVSECVARGAALECAFLSPTLRSREFEVDTGQITNIPVAAVLVYGGMTPLDLQIAMEKAQRDRVMEETKDKKNAIESYVYDMRNKVLTQCYEADGWLREKKQQLDALPEYANTVLLSADIIKKAKKVDRFCRSIMTKPKPAKPAAPDVQSAVPSRLEEIGLILFSYEELRDSTDDFSTTNFLGEGGFAKVYKGSLSNGRKVAVKVLRNENSKAEEEFRNEVDIISRARHINIVSLVGYCITPTKRLIVYEFVENRSLHDHLNGGEVMDWAVRIKIARGCAKGFAYLHEECPQKIIHRDVKPANILLDFSFVPKVADFGVSKLCPDHSDPLFATYIIGSKGFIDPAYVETQEYSTKSDVYSFGVVLLMLISGQINLNMVHELKKALPTTLSSGEFHRIADERLNNNYDVDEMTRMVTCADACLRRDPEDRPDMSQVSRVLENIVQPQI